MSKHAHTYSEEEFQELLTDENIVHLDRLREIACHGVPQSVRGEVWKILLGVSNPDLSEELSTRKKMDSEFQQLSKDVVVDVPLSKLVTAYVDEYGQSASNQVSDFFNTQKTKRKFKELLQLFLSNNPQQFHKGMIALLAPFIFCMPDSVDAFHCFSHLMVQLEYSPLTTKLNRTLSLFLFLFRTTLPELCMRFEDEELRPNDWAVVWLKYMLASALPLHCLLRLWDTYLAIPDKWELHPYVCVAILRHSTEDLMELECSELLFYLHHLPVLDIDQIIMHARNIRLDVLENKLL